MGERILNMKKRKLKSFKTVNLSDDFKEAMKTLEKEEQNENIKDESKEELHKVDKYVPMRNYKVLEEDGVSYDIFY